MPIEKPETIRRWGIRYTGDTEPYETYATEEEALTAYEAMKTKHQAGEEIVRLDTIVTVVRSADAAYARWRREEEDGYVLLESLQSHRDTTAGAGDGPGPEDDMSDTTEQATLAWWWVNSDGTTWNVSTSSDTVSPRCKTWAIEYDGTMTYHAVVYCHRVDAEQCAVNAWQRFGFSQAPQEATAPARRM